MSKEMQLLKSKIEFYKKLINYLNYLNYVTRSNKYNEKIIDYRKILDSLYERIQELKGDREVWKNYLLVNLWEV